MAKGTIFIFFHCIWLLQFNDNFFKHNTLENMAIQVMEVCSLKITYSGGQNKGSEYCINQKGVAEGKSAVTPLSSWT